MVQPMQGTPDSHSKWVRRLTDLRITDIPVVGGKNAGLGELTTALHGKGIPVPDGFATTAAAYRAFVEANHLGVPIRAHLAAWQRGEATLQQAGRAIRRLFLAAPFPPEIATAICLAYQQLGAHYQTTAVDVAVRSSATAEDLPAASVAGRQETFLHVTGEKELLAACRKCYASLFTDRAISYRADHGVDHLQVALSIGVQKMVRSDLAGAGVIFTSDAETGSPCLMLITAAWGLGESVVRGTVLPDQYQVFTPVLRMGLCPIIEKRLGAKARRVVYGPDASKPTRTVETPLTDRRAFVLTDAEILQLARWALTIEDHFDRPMDIEWAKDGQTGELFIVQAGPETGQSRLPAETPEVKEIPETRTRIMMNIASADAAMRAWRLPCHGIGLAPMELLINDVVKIHPMALARFDQLTDAGARTRIETLTRGYTDMTEYFVEHLARGIARMAVSQHPAPVIVRMSDLKSNEYADRKSVV